MTASLVTVLMLVVLQVGLALYVRNTLIWCAGEGARVGARAGSTPAMGAERARRLIGESLSDRFADDVTASYQQAGDVMVVQIQVNAPVPVIGVWGPGPSLRITGRAFAEEADR